MKKYKSSKNTVMTKVFFRTHSKSESSKRNNSSIVVSRHLEILYASFSEGLYFPFSRKTMVSLLTPTIFARASWVRSCLARNSFILVFTVCPPKALLNVAFSHEIPPENVCWNGYEDKKYTKHASSSKLNHFEVVRQIEHWNEYQCQKPGISYPISC